jgi:hypothetical protein
LLRTNAELRTKTVYAQRLEYLIQQRSETIDQLIAQVDQLRAPEQTAGERSRALDPHHPATRSDAQPEVGCCFNS